MLRGAARGWLIVVLAACGASELPASSPPDAANEPFTGDANVVDASDRIPLEDASPDIAVDAASSGAVDATSSGAVDATSDTAVLEIGSSTDAMSRDDAAGESGDGATFDPAVCLGHVASSDAAVADAAITDAAAADAALDDAADASCTPTPPTTLPQILSGEVAQVTAQCGVDGGPPPLVGQVPASTMIGLAIGLPLRNEQQAEYCIQLLTDPSSPIFRQYLTSDEFAAMYGPTACDYQAIIDWAQAQGFTVTSTYSNRLLVDVTATAGVVGAVFHVTFNYYLRPDGTQFYAPNQDPSFNLNVVVSGIEGFDNCQVPTPI